MLGQNVNSYADTSALMEMLTTPKSDTTADPFAVYAQVRVTSCFSRHQFYMRHFMRVSLKCCHRCVGLFDYYAISTKTGHRTCLTHRIRVLEVFLKHLA